MNPEAIVNHNRYSRMEVSTALINKINEQAYRGWLNCTEIHLGKREYTCALSPQFLSAIRKRNLESIFQKLNFRNKSCCFFFNWTMKHFIEQWMTDGICNQQMLLRKQRKLIFSKRFSPSIFSIKEDNTWDWKSSHIVKKEWQP